MGILFIQGKNQNSKSFPAASAAVGEAFTALWGDSGPLSSEELL